jgi:peptidoglycan-associated lipoprotein
VFIDASILSACGISSPRTYFEFDSAQVQGTDQGTLDQVATCMTTGALKGRNIEVVGHTDPRGSAQYNEQLGQSRAQSVAGYLGSKGVSSPKISTQSRGEAEATGTEPEGWSYDRRVDIRLVQ